MLTAVFWFGTLGLFRGVLARALPEASVASAYTTFTENREVNPG